MAYTLYIGDRLYSSWSLRGWLMLEKFKIPHKVKLVGLYSGTMAQDLAHLAPARLVPTLVTPAGTVIGESLAMAETLAEENPGAGLWPAAAAQRATARWLVSEMACGFGALRGDCPMQLSHIWQGFDPSEAVRKDLARIETLFAHARQMSGAKDGYLFGDYSLADVFYTPVAARIWGYDLPVSSETRAYCRLLLSDPAVLAWQEEARKVTYAPEPYALPLDRRDWQL
ncbi:glutathione S-transferase [Tritonibacter multivorans]|uniref:Glutathione S-transferase n=1 Tax=Tritonibacter multivorans TaxID=928856 RepID=A0A0N7LZG6_9RHOB|nr:glutathione S-transferase [Tritonibacter multivorans]MDA7421157.1 glutathione S-transferase [Tritonibacter multivorans]CUH77609.1 glutathione S-transferase [Tritonibacter multivorans]SFD34487.1 glutathione S-transferase [Tritonibacter multivorans]